MDEIPLSLMKHAVIMSQYNKKWVFVKRRDKNTWEAPGGRIEEGESIFECATRELSEETGASKFVLFPVTIYGVKESSNAPEIYGMLFYAIIYELGKMPPETEIQYNNLFENPPNDLTYPNSMPYLTNTTLDFLKRFHIC